MMILDFHCRLGGNPICKNLPCSGFGFSACDQQNLGYPNYLATCPGWDYIHNDCRPITLPQKGLLHIYFHHYFIN